MENLKKEILEWKKTDDFLEKKAEEEIELKKLESFLNEFNIKKIKELTIDEYIIGKTKQGITNTFCNWIEYKLDFFGSIGGGTSENHILYWSKDLNDYWFDNKNKESIKLFGNNKDEVLKNIKKYLLELINFTKNNDYRGIANHPFKDAVKNKISFLYSDNNQLPIYSSVYLDPILKDLNINFRKNENVVFKRKKLWDFYNEHFKDIISSPNLFVDFF